MKKHLPPYVYLRKGKPYFERRGWQSCRIFAEPGTPEFAIEYARILNGNPPQPRSRTFNALVQSYMRDTRYQRLSARSKADYGRVLDWVRDKLGCHSVAALRRPDVIRARDQNGGRFGNYIVQVLRVLCEHAIDQGWITENPAKGVSLADTTTKQREAWPPHLIEAYRGEATGRALLIFELCLGTGQRIGDVLKMRWDAIDGDGINVTQGKTGAKLWVPFTRRLRDVLNATPKRGLTICAHDNGRPTSYSNAGAIVMEVRRKIGADAYDLHSLRYSAAAELAALGLDDAHIAAVTGHASLRMVAKYAGPARQKVRAIRAQGERTQHER